MGLSRDMYIFGKIGIADDSWLYNFYTQSQRAYVSTFGSYYNALNSKKTRPDCTPKLVDYYFLQGPRLH